LYAGVGYSPSWKENVMNQKKLHRDRVEMFGPEGAAAIEQEWRQKPWWHRLGIRLSYIPGNCREACYVWRWRTTTNLKGLFGLLEDEGVPAGSWMHRPGQSVSVGRLWLQVLAGRLFGRREGE
jgi:hypothetical protein